MSSGGAVIEIRCQMGAKVAGVVASSVDQSGFSTAQELRPHQIHARRGNHAPVMADHTLAVENRQFKPGVIGPIAGCPYDRFDLARCEVHAKWRGILNTRGR